MRTLVQNPVKTENKEVKNPRKIYIHRIKGEGFIKIMHSSYKNLKTLKEKNPGELHFQILQFLPNKKISSYETIGYVADWSKGIKFNDGYKETHYFTTTNIIDLER